MTNLAGCKLISKAGLSPGLQYDLRGNEIIIGRSEDADIKIDSQVVSRLHARIVCRESNILIEDLNSSNGTFVNGMQIFSPANLSNGDQITLGQEIEFEFQSPVAAAEATRVAQPKAPPAALDATRVASGAAPAPSTSNPKVTISIAGAVPTTHELNKSPITIGRSEDNDIVIPSQVISRYHARLERVGADFHLTPMSSATNPFMLHGNPVTSPQKLNHLDELTIESEIPNTAVKLTYYLPEISKATVVGSVPVAQPMGVPAPPNGRTSSDDDR